MQKLFFITILAVGTFGALTADFWCDCTEFTSQTECNNVVDCVWGTACAKKACKDISTDVCDTLGTCTINNSGVCEDSKACSTYEAAKPILCMIQKGNCAAASLTPNANGKYTCSTYTAVADCSTLPTTGCSNNFISEEYFCWLNASTNKCDKFSTETCIGAPMDVCADLGCDASGTACKAFTCSSFTSEALCTVANDGIFGSQILCKWDKTTSKCGERSDVTDYTQDTCSKNTDGGYYWSNDACVACEDDESEDSSSPYLLASLAVFLTIIQ
ncbi:unnamed protein product (macronuclear) [Paramecium tetraurelia]|uniref:Uncharacterized protein n=1 Tax=Paramecium tetraurelia TaxID=5888 RepID=A0BPJ2_PARTE|nr:uncharacterized protein GSPATT00005208001 [Paramecium tetraurelia]CAK60459.1 unnamed protein product [Paramecium tetraurelia]|eukprot:XP_001427857.1 hypothetical protein (macronuclear) [Paramecium tetraurelia strain d4-2]